MGAMICPRCGTPLSTVAEGVTYVRCGHRPASSAEAPADDLVRAYQRWSYRAGWSEGAVSGRRAGFDEGYAAGFAAGGDAGAVRVALALETVLQGDPRRPAAVLERRAGR